MKTIYVLIDPETRKMRYVGLTKDVESRIDMHWGMRRSGDSPLKQWLCSLSTPPSYDVLDTVEDEYGIETEKHWTIILRHADNADLLNVYDAQTPREESRKKLSEARKAAWQRGRPKEKKEMTRETWSHTGTSHHAVTGHTGFAGVARYLNETFSCHVTRQLVYQWYTRRASTGFPEKQPVASSQRDLQLFDLGQVANWYRTHRLGDVTSPSLVGQNPNQ